MRRKMLRLSHTALGYWRRKDYPGLIDYLKGKRSPQTDAMKQGLKYDDEACAYVKKHNRLPSHFGGFEVVKPRTQWKFEVELTTIANRVKVGGIIKKLEPFQFVGVTDVVDLHSMTQFELKTGTTPASYYARSGQVDGYNMILSLLGHEIKESLICHYNQYLNETEIYSVLPSKTSHHFALKRILTDAKEIQDYLKHTGVKV